MVWDLSEFERARLEKARKLLHESEEGCRDLQLYVEGEDLRVQLQQIFLGENGQRRQGLTAQEKLQGVVVYLHMALRCLAAMFSYCFLEKECDDAISDALGELRDQTLPWGGLVCNVASAANNTIRADTIPSDRLSRILKHIANMTALPGFAALAAAAESHQRSSGFDPVLSAVDMRLLVLYSQRRTAGELLHRLPEAPEAHQWLELGLSAASQLLEQDPSAAACLHYGQGCLLNSSNRRPEALAAFRLALNEAAEHKSQLVETNAAEQLGRGLFTGAAGPRWNVEEVRGLLRTAKTALAECKRWMPSDMHAHFKADITRGNLALAAATARIPGAVMLPAGGVRGGVEAPVAIPTCSGCGKHASSLKKCSSCQVAGYCSRACQVRHWKQGGHKQECAALAAGSSSGAGSSRS